MARRPINLCPCGCSLQGGTLVVAVLDMIAAVSGVIAFGSAIFGGSVGAYFAANSHGVPSLAIIIVGLILSIGQFCLSLILLKGSNRRNLPLCQVWFICQCAFLAVMFLLFLIILAMIIKSRILDVPYIISGMISLVYRSYVIWVTFEFMAELRWEQVSSLDDDGENQDNEPEEDDN